MKLEFSFKSKDNFCNYSDSTEKLRNRYGLMTGITIGNSFNVKKGTAVSATVTSATAPAVDNVAAAVAEADLFGFQGIMHNAKWFNYFFFNCFYNIILNGSSEIAKTCLIFIRIFNETEFSKSCFSLFLCNYYSEEVVTLINMSPERSVTRPQAGMYIFFAILPPLFFERVFFAKF